MCVTTRTRSGAETATHTWVVYEALAWSHVLPLARVVLSQRRSTMEALIVGVLGVGAIVVFTIVYYISSRSGE